MNYLFELVKSEDCEEDLVIDATTLGNRSRFMNHGQVDEQCTVCTYPVMVRGVRRIAFSATRLLRPDTELLFSYGETFTKHHVLGDPRKTKGATAKSRH